ncbi:uncharacterized protein LOC143193043 [Rhynchophorus ferrugineus]|uniref:uncharacterized protein LOC143193043 n=1 Tax=Rhynchophorus ferrugineus TaxID=354439 RepID=UPI003FCD4852
MGYLVKFSVFILLSVQFGPTMAHQSQKSFRIYQLEDGCPEAKTIKLPIHLKNVNISLKNGTYYLAFNVAIYQNMPQDVKIEFQLVRCRDRGTLNSCENFHKITIPFFCKLMNIDGPWIGYVRSLEPPLRCPLKKGLYRLPNALTIDANEIGRLRLGDGNVFRINVKIFTQQSNKMVFCCTAEGQTINV